MQESLDVEFLYTDESDPGLYPNPEDSLIEGNPNSGDGHILVLDKDSCLLYEEFNASVSAGAWLADSGAIINLNLNLLRPQGWTSADAAGLPITPGLVRYAEVESGVILHALRFTSPQTRTKYVWPARHDLAFEPVREFTAKFV